MADNGKKRSLSTAKIPKRRLHLRSVDDESPDDGRVYEGVGMELRTARKERDEELRDVAERLHIRYAYLHAIEEGDFDQLPGTVYALGFVRTYAEHLDRDADNIVTRFKNEAEGLPLQTELSFLEPVQEGRMPRGTLIVLSILIAATVYGAWYFFASRDRRVIESVPPVPDRLAQSLPPDEDRAVAERERGIGADLETPEEASGEGAVMGSAAGNGATPETDSGIGFIDETATGGDSLLGDGKVPIQIPESYEPKIYGATGGGSRVTIRARADTWVQVQADETGGEVMLTRILHEGDEYWVPNRDDLVLMTGNAGALEIVVDGRTLAGLGPIGSVRRDISLDPDDLLKTYAP